MTNTAPIAHDTTPQGMQGEYPQGAENERPTYPPVSGEGAAAYGRFAVEDLEDWHADMEFGDWGRSDRFLSGWWIGAAFVGALMLGALGLALTFGG